MKVKLNEKLFAPDGITPLEAEKGKHMTLGDVCINSLLAPIQGDDEKKKWRKYELFRNVRDAKGEIELKAEEIVLIKECIGKLQSTLVMGQCWDLLEGKLITNT